MEGIQSTAGLDFRCQKRWAAQNVIGFLKKGISKVIHFLFRSRKIIFLIIAVVLVTLFFIFLIASWINNDVNNNANNDVNNDANGEINDRTVSTTGTIYVRDLEIFGGDTKSESGNVYIDWGELTLGASKKASFYVRSNRNIDVKLGLNVANWAPAGIEDYIDIYWDYNGSLLSSDSCKAPLLVTVSLDVSSSDDFVKFIVGNGLTSFGFDMTVYASGV